MFIGANAGAGFGALAGFMAGLGWVFTFMGISYLFESRTLAHFLINSVYSIVSLTIMGLIIGDSVVNRHSASFNGDCASRVIYSHSLRCH